jgi:hypothetical protein
MYGRSPKFAELLGQLDRKNREIEHSEKRETVNEVAKKRVANDWWIESSTKFRSRQIRAHQKFVGIWFVSVRKSMKSGWWLLTYVRRFLKECEELFERVERLWKRGKALEVLECRKSYCRFLKPSGHITYRKTSVWNHSCNFSGIFTCICIILKIYQKKISYVEKQCRK